MKKPNIVALPTSQMLALCDVLGLGEKVQSSTESMVVALEAADFRRLEVDNPVAGKPRKPNTIGFELDEVSADIVAQRKANMRRT